MTASTRAPRVWALIPAAGVGRRMGRSKQVLPYGDTTVVGAVCRTLLAGGAEGIIVVTRPDLAGRLGVPDDARVCVDTRGDPAGEMIDSIVVGLGALGGLSRLDHGAFPEVAPPRATDGVLVVPADMPKLSSGACAACIRAFRDAPTRIIIATHDGRRGHPIVFPYGLREHVHDPRRGLAGLVERFADRVTLVETRDPTVLQDIDTREDYDRL